MNTTGDDGNVVNLFDQVEVPGFVEEPDGRVVATTSLPRERQAALADMMTSLRELAARDPVTFRACIQHLAALYEEDTP